MPHLYGVNCAVVATTVYKPCFGAKMGNIDLPAKQAPEIVAQKQCDPSNVNNFSRNRLLGNRRFRPRQLIRVIRVVVQGHTQGEVEYQKKNGGKGCVGSAYGF
jgi:hypothetical protein